MKKAWVPIAVILLAAVLCYLGYNVFYKTQPAAETDIPIELKVDYEPLRALLPQDKEREIIAARHLEITQSSRFTVAAVIEKNGADKNACRVFVFKRDMRGVPFEAVWTSPGISADSVLNANIHILQFPDYKAIVAAEYHTGDSSKPMREVEIFTVSVRQGIQMRKSLSLGDGDIKQVENTLEIRSKLLEKTLRLTFENGVYTEK